MTTDGKILITGGAGYIGSHTAHAAVDAGHDVVILDDLSTGAVHCVPDKATFVHGSIADMALVTDLMTGHEIRAVLHFAGRIVVPESVENPVKYYLENTVQTLGLLQACLACGVQNFIFSSTAAVYAPPSPAAPVLDEEAPLQPLSPYGQSKLMSEQMIRDIGIAHGLNSVILRYFNVAGADPSARTGQCTPDATHLIKVACQTALGQRPSLSIFGDDYETSDGTCLRDYIHVSDLAAAHVLALEKLFEAPGRHTLNCGYGKGSSVHEVVAAVEKVTGRSLPVEIVPRRAGDAPALVADNSRLLETLDWQPRHTALEKMVRTALDWEAGLARRDLAAAG